MVWLFKFSEGYCFRGSHLSTRAYGWFGNTIFHCSQSNYSRSIVPLSVRSFAFRSWLDGVALGFLVVLYTFAIFVASLVGVAIGLLVSAAAHTGEVAAGVLPLVILPMVILGGILLPLSRFAKVT